MTYVRTKLQTRPQINTVGDILEKESVKELVQFERYCRDNALFLRISMVTGMRLVCSVLIRL